MKLKIIEDIAYSIDDIIDQIDKTFGFVYTKINSQKGYIILGNRVKLTLEFNEDDRKLDSAVLKFPSQEIDFIKSPATADIYASSIESAVQIIDLVNRMLGGNSDDTNSK